MNLGNKIVNLRKKNNLSQEELAEKVGVTRQTISKWELEETTPDIKQAKALSKIFKVSLDELTDNDVESVLIEKVSNTEKLAGLIIKILKIVGIGLLVLVIISILTFIFFNINTSSKSNKVVGQYALTCKIDNEQYSYNIEYNKNYQVINSGGDAWISNHTEVDSYDDANKALAHIEDYFKEHDGSCTLEK